MCVIYDGEWVGVAKPLTCSVCVFSLEWLTPFYYDDVYAIYYRLKAEIFKHFVFKQVNKQFPNSIVTNRPGFDTSWKIRFSILTMSVFIMPHFLYPSRSGKYIIVSANSKVFIESRAFTLLFAIGFTLEVLCSASGVKWGFDRTDVLSAIAQTDAPSGT